MSILTVEDLRDHVDLAVKVELATIPPYLYAMYSIKDQRSAPARLIASVVVEEMLHVCLTANLLLALGGEPDFTPSAMPTYPSLLPHHRPPLALELRECTTTLIRETFMRIERPASPQAPPEDDDYETLGQFYRALEEALDDLGAETDLFVHHQPERQLSDPSFYGPVAFDAADSGGLILIDDRETARQALEVVIHQGEGVGFERWADPGHHELTHFYKFEQLATGSIEMGPVWPVLENARTADFPDRMRGASDLFNVCYRLIFVTLEEIYSGAGAQSRLIGRLYALMTDCLSPAARYLVRQPIEDGHTSCPTFEAYPLGTDPWAEAAGLAVVVEQDHPELEGVAARLHHLAAR